MRTPKGKTYLLEVDENQLALLHFALQDYHNKVKSDPNVDDSTKEEVQLLYQMSDEGDPTNDMMTSDKGINGWCY